MNTNTPDTKALSEKFIHQICGANRIKLRPFSEKRWFSGAYSTIQRTLSKGFKPLNSENREACRKQLFEGLKTLTPDNFDEEMKSLIGALSKNFKISVGHAQKLVSILLKYAFVTIQCDDKSVPDEIAKLVASSADRFPVPIDAIVLFQLKKTDGVNSDGIRAYRRPNEDGEFMHTASVRQGKSFVTWSRLTDYKTYWNLQERIRAVANENHMTPIEFEMRNLWRNE
jgi:hypothetical protein